MTDMEERMIKIEEFYSNILNNNREINIYLPASYYESSQESYPVIYMHDGQNVFDGERAYAGVGWMVHEVHDELVSRGIDRKSVV